MTSFRAFTSLSSYHILRVTRTTPHAPGHGAFSLPRKVFQNLRSLNHAKSDHLVLGKVFSILNVLGDTVLLTNSHAPHWTMVSARALKSRSTMRGATCCPLEGRLSPSLACTLFQCTKQPPSLRGLTEDSRVPPTPV